MDIQTPLQESWCFFLEFFVMFFLYHWSWGTPPKARTQDANFAHSNSKHSLGKAWESSKNVSCGVKLPPVLRRQKSEGKRCSSVPHHQWWRCFSILQAAREMHNWLIGTPKRTMASHKALRKQKGSFDFFLHSVLVEYSDLLHVTIV